MTDMDSKARRALRIIRECVAEGRYRLTRHFLERMDERGFFWPDIVAILDEPSGVRSDGRDEFDRPKWVVSGDAPDGVPIDIVCVFDEDDQGRQTIFITVY